MEKKTCEDCDAMCCRYIAMEIDTPEEEDDFENIKWYVAHKNVSVYVEEDGVWNLEFNTPCAFLRDDGKCAIHEDFVDNPKVKRPKICKEYSAENCLFHNDDYNEKYRFQTIKEVEDYIENVFKKGLHEIPEEDGEEDEESEQG